MYRRFLGLIVLFLAGSAQADVVRFWVGDRNNYPVLQELPRSLGMEAHLQYLSTVLLPGTVTQGYAGGNLTGYVVYIPPQTELKDTFLSVMPITEAAIPMYRNRASYEAARTAHPEYGPLHFEPNGFAKNRSGSKEPVPFLFNPEAPALSIPLNWGAFDLSPSEIDWRKGTVLAWMVVRRADGENEPVEVAEYAYRESVARLLSRFGEGSDYAELMDGHFARVEEGYVLHFIHLKHPEAYSIVSQKLMSDLMEEGRLAGFPPVKAFSLRPFAEGWKEAIQPGRAINVQFQRCEDRLSD